MGFYTKDVLVMMIVKESADTEENCVISNKTLRYMAYRASFYHLKSKNNKINWNRPALRVEKGGRVPLHLCIVNKIRSQYPEQHGEEYTGFKPKRFKY